MFRPASKAMSTSLVASLTSVTPKARISSFLAPNVPVPRQRAGTFNPEPPSCLNSMIKDFVECLDFHDNYGPLVKIACNLFGCPGAIAMGRVWLPGKVQDDINLTNPSRGR